MRQTFARVLDDLGRRLAELRRERDWTQAQAAEKTGMSETDYRAIEHGRRAITLRTAFHLAETFGVPLRAMFDAPVSRAPRKPGRPASTN